MKLVKIEESPYMRDLETNAIVNTNRQEIECFNIQRRKILQEKQDKEETKLRLAKMEQEMGEIKQLLKEIAQLRSEHGN